MDKNHESSEKAITTVKTLLEHKCNPSAYYYDPESGHEVSVLTKIAQLDQAAMSHVHLEIAELLIESGCRLDTGKILHFAINTSNRELVKIILRSKKWEQAITDRLANHQTPLHMLILKMVDLAVEVFDKVLIFEETSGEVSSVSLNTGIMDQTFVQPGGSFSDFTLKSILEHKIDEQTEAVKSRRNELLAHVASELYMWHTWNDLRLPAERIFTFVLYAFLLFLHCSAYFQWPNDGWHAVARVFYLVFISFELSRSVLSVVLESRAYHVKHIEGGLWEMGHAFLQIVFVLLSLVSILPQFLSTQRQAETEWLTRLSAAMANPLGTFILLLAARGIPKLTSVALYLRTYRIIIRELSAFFFMFFISVLSLSISFHILLGIKNSRFSTVLNAFMKTLAIMIGEITFDDTFSVRNSSGYILQNFNNQTVLTLASHIFLLFFMVFMIIIMFSLLIGLITRSLDLTTKRAGLERARTVADIIQKAMPLHTWVQYQLSRCCGALRREQATTALVVSADDVESLRSGLSDALGSQAVLLTKKIHKRKRKTSITAVPKELAVRLIDTFNNRQRLAKRAGAKHASKHSSLFNFGTNVETDISQNSSTKGKFRRLVHKVSRRINETENDIR